MFNILNFDVFIYLVGKYVCCGEKMAPFGRLHGAAIDRTRYIVMYGSSGGIYCYDAYDDAVYQLGDSLPSFYNDGLRRLDPIYDTGIIPPKLLVDGIVASLVEAETVSEFSAIVVANQGCIYDMSDTIAGIDSQLMLYRGDFGVVTSCSLGTSINLASIMCAVVRRLSCTFEVFGVVGYKAGVSMFRPRLILLIDPFGVIYGYDNCLNRVSRLAESFKMFIRLGTRKSIFNFRHDRGYRGASRLERVPYCPHVGNVREIIMDPDADYTTEPQYIGRIPNEAFSVSRVVSFGEPIGHDVFLGRRNRFFDSSRINKNQCMEGFVADVCSHYDAAIVMRAAYYGFTQITDKLWPEEIEGLLMGHPSCLPMASDPFVKAALERLRVVRTVEDNGEDSDTESIVPALNDPPCKRCVERRRMKMFKKLKGM